jgi:hypothetical protein
MHNNTARGLRAVHRQITRAASKCYTVYHSLFLFASFFSGFGLFLSYTYISVYWDTLQLNLTFHSLFPSGHTTTHISRCILPFL